MPRYFMIVTMWPAASQYKRLEPELERPFIPRIGTGTRLSWIHDPAERADSSTLSSGDTPVNRFSVSRLVSGSLNI